MPTLSKSTLEASTTNPVVADLLHIYALHACQIFLNPSVFYLRGMENCMADDTSRLFDLADTPFFAHMSVNYLQPHILWQLCPLPPQLLSCVISTLNKKLCEQGLYRMRANRSSIGSGSISAPPCQSALLSNIHPSLKLKPCRYMETGSNMPSTPSVKWTDLGKSRFLRHGGKLRQPTSWIASLTQESLPMLRPTPE